MGSTLWSIRSTNSHTDVEKLYESLPHIFTIRIQHGGMFSKAPGRRYVLGKVNYVDFVDIDEFSVHELDIIFEELGYLKTECIYYHFCMPGSNLDIGLLPLGNDQDVIRLSTYVAKNKEICVYSEHGSTNLTIEPGSMERDERMGEQAEMGFIDPLFDFGQQVVPYNGNIGADYGTEQLENIGFHVDVSDGSKSDNEGGSSSDSDYVMNEDDLVEDYEVDMSEFHSVVDTNVEWVAKEKKKQPMDTCHEEEEIEVIDEDKFDFVGFEEDPRERLLKELTRPKYCSSGKVHGSEFYVGQTFETKKELTTFVKEHAFQTRRDLHLEKNDAGRVRVVCRGVSRELNSGGLLGCNKGNGSSVNKEKGICPWVLQVSRPSDLDIWTVKTYEENHKCLQTRDVKSCTQSFIAKKIAAQVELNPHCLTRALQEEFQMKYGVNVSKSKVFRARVIANNQIHGDYEKQYSMLRDYIIELQATNPGTTVKLEVESESNINLPTRKFKRIYICLGALKHGFKESQREILGLDGSFMKGPYPGQILTAVSVDSNNGMFPVAYAIVEAETMNSWSWFLECLGEDLDLPTRANFTFISDRQKGILPAIAKIFPCAEHRFCLRHIHENMKLRWRGNQLKEMLWKCATATTVIHFEKQMEELSTFNRAAYDWLKQIPPVHWARSHFTGRSHCQILLNNMCEIFNAKLIDGRDKPIISALEYIREYLMRRMCSVQQVIDKSLGPLTPTATKLLEKIEIEAQQMRVIFAGNEKYQVTGVWNDQFVVNMSERSCSCRKWELIGMPCKHAVAVIWDMMQNGRSVERVEYWVHECYWFSTWQKMYKVKVDPINGRDMWQKSTCPSTITPPKHKKQVGKPKKKRVRGADEVVSQGTKLTGKFLTVTCSKCHNKGHNSRSCKGQGGEGEGSKAAGRKSKNRDNGATV